MTKRRERTVSREAEDAEWRRVRSWTESSLARLSRPPATEEEGRRNQEILRMLAITEPIVADLQHVGIPLRNLDEFANVQLLYPVAAPILLAHLDREYPENIRAALLQALQRPYGRNVLTCLLAKLRNETHRFTESQLHVLGAAIAANATKADIGELLSVIRDERFASARLPLLLRVARWRDPRVPDVVLSVFRSGHMTWGALRSLRLQQIWSVAEEVHHYLSDPTADFREEARAYFKALERAKNRDTARG